MKTPEEKYMNDADYHALVNMLHGFIHKAQFTPSEIREASIYACLRYEMTQPAKPLFMREPRLWSKGVD